MPVVERFPGGKPAGYARSIPRGDETLGHSGWVTDYPRLAVEVTVRVCVELGGEEV
jgi:hypothetical protein